MNRFQFVADHRTPTGEAAVPGPGRHPVQLLLLAGRRRGRAARQAPTPRPGRADPRQSTRSSAAPTARPGSPPSSARQGGAVNHKRVARVMRRFRHRRAPLATQAPHHRPGPGRRRRSRTCSTGTSPPTRRTPIRRRHHVSAARRRGVPLPGDRDRLLFTPGGRLVDRRPHAHRTGRRRPGAAARDPRQPGRGDLAHRSRVAIQLQGLRRPVPELGVTQSMGAVGTSADNALAECFNASLKRETLQGYSVLATSDLPETCSAG